jgi:hypothetical protein
MVVMEETSGERGRIEPTGALSRPLRLKPVPADLSLFSPAPHALGVHGNAKISPA